MKISDYITTEADTKKAIEGICAEAAADFTSERPDLGLVFVSPHHASEFPTLGEKIMEQTGARNLIGCTAESVIAGGREVERSPALALWLAAIPDASIQCFHTVHESSTDSVGFTGLPEKLERSGEDDRMVVLLGDPFSLPIVELLQGFNDGHGGLPLVGGMASGGMTPGDSRLFLNREVHLAGGVGALVTGSMRVDTVVSQGCRPIGKRYVVTRSDRNLILEMGSRPAAQCIDELMKGLPDGDRHLFEQGPHIGVAINEHQTEFQRGDFLIRNIMGWDSQSGALVINDLIRRGQTIQFQVRDSETASEDLGVLIGKASESDNPPPKGGLIFSCNGRGTRLFDQADHDVGMVRERMGDIPMAGFFAAGEIGPVGGKNFLHGFTASVVLLRERS